MTAVAFKEPSVSSYPVSDAARERIKSARFHDLAFEMRRVLIGGGYTSREADTIVEVVYHHMQQHMGVKPDILSTQLHARGLPIREAREIGKALAR